MIRCQTSKTTFPIELTSGDRSLAGERLTTTVMQDDDLYALMSRSFTITTDFSHTMNACLYCISPSGFHSGAPSVEMTSKFQSILVTIMRISMYARLEVLSIVTSRRSDELTSCQYNSEGQAKKVGRPF
jgi:hypothetical protein